MAIKLYSRDAEFTILGQLLTDSKLVNKVLGRLEADDFYFPENKAVYSAIQRSFKEKQSTDAILVISYLQESKLMSHDEWMDLLYGMVSIRGIDSDLELYIEEVLDKSHKRRLQSTLKEQSEQVSMKEQPVDKLVTSIEAKIFEATRKKELKDFKHIEEATSEFTYDIENPKEVTEINSGMEKLNKVVPSFNPGDLIIIAARPSMGKTAFSLALAKNMAVEHNVAYFSIEMPAKQIVERLISSVSLIPAEMVKNPSSWSGNHKESINLSIDKINKLHLRVDDSPNAELGQIAWKARKLKEANQLDVIIIDYLGLITVEQNGKRIENKTAEVSEISRQLKSLARELEVPVIVLSQLNRSVESREVKIPMMSDLRDSGSIEQDADVIMFLYRDAYYNKPVVKTPVEELLVRVSKNRNGTVGDITLKFQLQTGVIKSDKSGEQ